ncbi:MAG: hypothetical protein IKP47_10870 [Ruminococcus sp.]|nr:hypothetical protein [Ruminococcus sp.]
MPWIIDLAALALIALTAFIGYKRGFIRYVIKLLGTAACIVAALIVSDMISGPIYRNIVAPRLENSIRDELRGFDITQDVRKSLEESGVELDMTDDELKKILSDNGSISAAFEREALSSGKTKEEAAELRDKTQNFFENDFGTSMLKSVGFGNAEILNDKLDISAAKAFDLVRAFASRDGLTKGVNYIVTNVLDKMMTALIRYVLFIVLFIIGEAILAVVFSIAGVLDHLPAVSGTNRFLGLLLGILKGVLYIVLAAAIISSLCDSGAVADSSPYEDSHFFGMFFSLFHKG